MQINTLEDVNKFLNQYFGREINFGQFDYSGNDKCMIMTLRGVMHPEVKHKMKMLELKPPQGLGVYSRKGRWYFTLMRTAQDVITLSEVKAWVIGKELLANKTETLKLLEEYGASLKDLVEVKKAATQEV